MEQQRQALATLPGLTTRGSVTATCRRPALGTALLRHEVADTLKITGSTLWPRMSTMARALLPAMTKGSSRCWCRWPQWSWLALMPPLALMPVTKVLLPCLCLFGSVHGEGARVVHVVLMGIGLSFCSLFVMFVIKFS